MAELARQSGREQLGAGEPAASAHGVSVRLADIAAQHYVSGATLAANTIAGSDPYTLWLAPDRALLVGAIADIPAGFVSDMTDGLAVFDISGPRADEVIAMGCTLAPSGPALARGRCAQTVFGGVRVILYRRGDGFRVHVERQLAAFLLEWFSQAVSALA
jgi:heterotetrameric sarcosine oxidase gamma subunit